MVSMVLQVMGPQCLNEVRMKLIELHHLIEKSRKIGIMKTFNNKTSGVIGNTVFQNIDESKFNKNHLEIGNDMQETD